MQIEQYQKCQCGAITVIEGNSAYSVKQSNFKKFFPDVDLRKLKGGRLQTTCNCNHCVNHWGLELCGCGSGELFGECTNNYRNCNVPMQKIDEYECVF